MRALLCSGRPALASACRPVPGARADYFGADQPRIATELFLPWTALGLDAAPTRLPIEITAISWHRARTMRLAGTLVLDKNVPAASSGGK